MTEKTIRQTLREEAAGFETIEAAVFTTFNFHPEFFEDNVLPALFDIDDRREARRRIQVNHRLLRTEVCTLYDASTRPTGGGDYRYQRVGMFRAGGFFHPKLIFLAGIHQDDGRPWIYVTAASANLTLSGWGKNQEVIGEAWIGNNRQILFGQVRDALTWLRDNGAGRARTPILAIERCLAILDRMGGGSGSAASTDASFYFSPLHANGFWPFLQDNQTAKWDDILALSPYWGDVAENIRLANSRNVRLAPAMLNDGNYGLGRNGLPQRDGLELLKLGARLENNRFWHTKTYVLTRGDRIRVGVGSANFTGAGLKGGADGNVEAMLVFEVDARNRDRFLPELVSLPVDDHRIPEKNADEGPEPADLEITVAFDWKARDYLIYFTPAEDPDTRDYRLVLPGCEPILLDGTSGLRTIPDAKGPVSGSSFSLRYLRAGTAMVFDGLINEINVDLGDKPYFRPLSLLEILESWRLPADSPPMPKGVDDDTDPDAGADSGGNASPPSAQFDVLNFYEMYRSFYALRARMDEAAGEKDFERLRGLLVTRPDSVYRVAKQAGEDSKDHPMQRFLVLLECREIMASFRKNVPRLDTKFQCEVEEWVNQVRMLAESLPWPSQTIPSAKALSWFEIELKQAWRK
jgi:hypothetical protein